ncbi:reverse transcriptase domain-containing protein [Tanacetum coccineum]
MIDQGVTAALAARDANRNGDDSHTSGMGGKRTERVVRECTYQDFMKCKLIFQRGASNMVGFHVLTVSHDVAYAMTWADLRKKMTDKYYPRNEMKKLEAELWNLKVKGTDVIGYNQRFQELALLCVRMFPEESDKIERPETYLLRVWSSRTLQEGMPKAEEQQKPWKSSWSFVSTAFSSQIDITPSTLDHYYDVELADGRIIVTPPKNTTMQRNTTWGATS